MMTVADYLEREGMSELELAELVDAKPHAVRSRLRVAFPKTWASRLGLELDEPSPNGDEPSGRANEQQPQPPAGARVVEPPPSPLEGIDYGQLAGMIEGAYKLGAHTVSGSDPALAGAIESHAAQAGQAWAKWVESEPKVAALLQRMMVGTPLGEVIAVHVGIGFSYFLARAAIARARRESEPESEPEPAGGDFADLGPEPAFAGA